MAVQESLSSRVASAFMSLALEENKVLEYQDALKMVRQSFKDNPKLPQILSSYSVDKSSLFTIIDKIYGGNDLKYLCPFLKELVDRHMINEFEDVYNSFLTLSNEYLGIKEGIVYSVKLLEDDQLEALEKVFSTKYGYKVHFKNRVEPSLLGGVKVFIDGKVYDGTLQTKLDYLREELLNIKEGGN